MSKTFYNMKYYATPRKLNDELSKPYLERAADLVLKCKAYKEK